MPPNPSLRRNRQARVFFLDSAGGDEPVNLIRRTSWEVATP